MGTPVKIVVTAETAQAAAALQQFAAQAGSGLKTMGKDAAQASEGIRGMSYYFRSSIDQIRFAAAGGGARAAFYSIDEAVRGLMASGMKLSTLVPVIGGLTAVVGAGYLVWSQYKSAEEQAIQSANDMTEALTKLPEILRRIHDAAAGGILPKGTAEEMNQALAAASTTPVPNPKNEGWLKRTLAELGGMQAGPEVYAGVKKEEAEAQAAYQASLPGVQEKINAELAQLGILLEKTGAEGKVTYEKNPELEALEKIDDLRQKITAETLEGADRERAVARQKHDEEIDQLNQRLQLAQKARQELQTKLGEATTPGVKIAVQTEIANADTAIEKLNALKVQTDTALATKLAGIDQKAQEEAARKEQEATRAQVEEANKIREQGLKDFADTNKQIENQITVQALSAGKEREDLWQEEYKQRIIAAENAVFSGQIGEKEYQQAVTDAQIKMLEGQKRYNEEIERSSVEQMNNARADIEARIAAIQTNSLLTRIQKEQEELSLKQQLLDLDVKWLAVQQQLASATLDETAKQGYEREIESLKKEIARLENEVGQGEADKSLTGGIERSWTKLADKVDNFSDNVGGVVTSPFQGLDTGLDAALNNMMLKGTTFREFWRTISIDIAEDFLKSLSKMAADETTHLAMMATQYVLHAAEKLAVHVAGEQAQTGATAAGSAQRVAIQIGETLLHGIQVAIRVAAHVAGEIIQTAVTLAQSAIRIAAIVAETGYYLIEETILIVVDALKGLAMFQEGGYTGQGMINEPAGVVHRGEYIFSAPAVQRIGVQNLESLHRGYADGGLVGGSAAPTVGHTTNIEQAVFMDVNKMIEHLSRSDAHEKYIVDVMGRNIHRFR